MTAMTSRVAARPALVLMIVASLAFSFSARVLARPAFSTATIAVSLTFTGPFSYQTTIHSKAHSTNVGLGACYVIDAKVAAGTMFQVIAHRGANLSSGDSFTLGVIGYRSSVTNYTVIKAPSGSSPYPFGASFNTTVHKASGHTHEYTSSAEGVRTGTLSVRVSNGGASGSFTASHLAKAAGETITGSWRCSHVQVIKPRG